jgi:hypothetical protein
MGNGQWAMGNGQWAMGNGQWAMGKTNFSEPNLPINLSTYQLNQPNKPTNNLTIQQLNNKTILNQQVKNQ